MLATAVLVLINIAVYLSFALRASSPFTVAEFSPAMALTREAIVGGDFGRLVTSLFFHFDLPHLGYNMLFLLIFGSRCEEIFGVRRFLLIYFLAGTFSALSVFFYPPGSALAGASGAIFGLLGSVLIAQRNLYAHGFATSLLYGIIFFILAVATGFMAHLLGMVMGFSLGYLFTSDEQSHLE
jgi:rhomboid protease GluP